MINEYSIYTESELRDELMSLDMSDSNAISQIVGALVVLNARIGKIENEIVSLSNPPLKPFIIPDDSAMPQTEDLP